jgi:hypothetical protein
MRRLLLRSAVLVTVAASAIGLSPPVHAVTGTQEIPSRTWNTNGTVFDTELSDDGSTLYIGGKFTRVRENPPGVAGRSFAANSVAAIDVATGEAISTWNPGVTGGTATVRALELSADGNKVFIGGNFASVGGQPRQNLAAVDATDGSLDPFAPTVTASGQTPWVYALLANDSKLYVGGAFSIVEGKSRPRLAAFDLSTGALDSAWRPKTNGINVRELEFDNAGTSIFVAGRFNSLTGSDGVSGQRESVARVFTDTGNLHPWAIPLGVVGDPQVGFDLTVSADGNRLYGGFGLGPNFAAAYRLDNGNTGSLVWHFRTTGNVQTVALSPDGTRLFFGGHFGTRTREQTVCGNRVLSGLASVNPATGAIDCDWVPQLEPSTDNPNGAWDLTTTETHLWVGGGFTHVSGVDQSNLARFALTQDPTAACTIVGTPDSDTLTGTASDDVICGGGGRDTIKGLEGNDILKGEGGADQLYGALGDDHLVGEGGADTLKGAGGNDALDSRDGVEGNDTVDGGVGTDTCTTDATEKSVVGCEL